MMTGTAYGETRCSGREYPAKVIATFARSARLDVDLGFGIRYSGIVELDGTKEPNKSVAAWYGKASEALGRLINGKVLTLCVVNGDGKRAYFFVDGTDVNKQMIADGLLDPIPFPPFGISTSF